MVNFPTTQLTNMSRWRVENLRTNFVPTQSALNISGKFLRSIWYGPPNQTWLAKVKTTAPLNCVNYTLGSIEITDQDFENNTNLVQRSAVRDTDYDSSVVNWIMDRDCQHWNDPDTEIKADVGVYYERYQQSDAHFIMYKFTGCTPNAVIGTMFITLGMSFVPVSSMNGIFRPAPRGEYEGTWRLLK